MKTTNEMSELEKFFREEYPHLNDEEIDRCCTNIRKFRDVVIKVMEREENEKLLAEEEKSTDQ